MDEKTCLNCGSEDVLISGLSTSKGTKHYTTTCLNPTCLKINKVSAILDLK